MTFNQLKDFLENQMRMSHIYQPLLILTLLESGDLATLRQLAIEFASRYEVQIEDYRRRILNMPVKVLKKHAVIERDGELIRLNTGKLTLAQRAELKMLCEQKIQAYIIKHDLQIWDYKRMGKRHIPDELRERLLIEASGRCALCGRTREVDRLEIDHIVPVSKGGKDTYENLQVLCRKCNAVKSNAHSADLRSIAMEHREGCLFCTGIEKEQTILENELAYVILDKHPVTQGHSLVIPKRHVEDYFHMTRNENDAVFDLLRIQKRALQESDPSIIGFNVGVNNGRPAGQTIMHCHVHLIPRRAGDVDDPTGGVRGVVAGKQRY